MLKDIPFLILGLKNRKEIIILGLEDVNYIFIERFCALYLE